MISVIYQVSVWIIPVLVAITFHEAAHGYVAWRLGDHTAKDLGRVSFSPIRHIELMGTIIVPLMLLIFRAPFLFGWATDQMYFKELTDQDVRKRLYEEQKNQIEQDMSPFGFISDGLEDDSFVDAEGDRWKVDEYGDRSYMWDYR